MIGVALSGIAVLATIGWVAVLSELDPRRMDDRGLISIVPPYAFVFVGVTPIGSFLVGSIAEFVGVPAAFAAGGGLGLLCVLGLTLWWTRSPARRSVDFTWF